MPKQTIYIREEDLEKWKQLKDKSTKIHDMLNAIPPTYTPQPVTASIQINGDSANSSQSFIPRPPDPETGYPCCQGARPCQHWRWDGVKGVYRNSLTGKEREVTQ